VIVGWNGYRLSFDQAMQTEEALTNKDHVAESYMTVDRLSNPYCSGQQGQVARNARSAMHQIAPPSMTNRRKGGVR
jgi:hypothetical protein